MKTLFERLSGTLNHGKDAVLVTVVASSGSTPRGAGARMLVTDEGRIYGTIGGGAVEYRAQQLAGEVLVEGRSRMESFILRKNEVQDLGMVCGGDVTVYFHFLSAQDGGLLTAVRAALELFAAGEICWLVTGLFPDGGLSLYGAERGLIGPEVPACVLDEAGAAPRQVEADGKAWYVEPLLRSGVVYIFGGGHVAQALVPALTAVDFRCVVLEDRPEFCRPALFPGVEETILIDNARVADFVTLTGEDWVVIMTRGHANDLLVQSQVMKSPVRYIGVIGSKRKTAAVTEKLMDMGFTREDFRRVCAPIGLPIRSETPAEIAVSIAAQLIMIRAETAPRG